MENLCSKSFILRSYGSSRDNQKESDSRYKITSRDRLCAVYVEDFLNQFKALNPGRKPPDVFAKDSQGYTRFVSTFVRPISPTYANFNDAKFCAKFVSDLISIEPSSDYMFSMITPLDIVLERRRGDIYDTAILLCSLLIGASYDAYCVCGKVNKQGSSKLERNMEEIKKFENSWSDFDSKFKVQSNKTSSASAKYKYNTIAPKDMLKITNTTDTVDGGNDVGSEGKREPYSVSNRFKFESKTLLSLEQKKNKEKEGECIPEFSFHLDSDDEDIFKGNEESELSPVPDAWILVKSGSKSIGQDFFIDPATGEVFSCDEDKFHSVDFIFNNLNAYVNTECIKNMGEDPKECDQRRVVDFDFTKEALWEPVFRIPETKPRKHKTVKRFTTAPIESSRLTLFKREEVADEFASEENGVDMSSMALVQVPESFIPVPKIKEDLITLSFGNTGHKVFWCLRGKVELFSEKAQGNSSGLVRRDTEYMDKNRVVPIKRIEYFKNRTDKLLKREYDIETDTLSDFFEYGREDGIKKFVDCVCQRTIYEFYKDTRFDGLLERTDDLIKHEIVMRYEEVKSLINPESESKTFLKTRRVQLASIGGNREAKARANRNMTARSFSSAISKKSRASSFFKGNQSALSAGTRLKRREQQVDYEVVSIIEQYELRKEGKSFLGKNDTDKSPIQCIEYMIKDQIIKVTHFHEPGKMIQTQKIFFKGEGGESHKVIWAQGWREKLPEELADELLFLTASEKECYGFVRQSERDYEELLSNSRKERSMAQRKLSYIEEARRRTVERAAREKALKEENERRGHVVDSRYVESLTVCLRSMGKLNVSLNSQEAHQARDACLQHLKERLVFRAKLIEDKLVDEKTKLESRKAAYERSREQNDVNQLDDSFDQYKTEAEFKIQILEARLQQQEKYSIEKFTELDAKLKLDPRLSMIAKAKKKGVMRKKSRLNV